MHRGTKLAPPGMENLIVHGGKKPGVDAAAESRAGIEESSGEDTEFVIYYADESGRKVAHYFKKGS